MVSETITTLHFRAIGKLIKHSPGLGGKVYRIAGLEAPGDEVHTIICSGMACQTSREHSLFATVSLRYAEYPPPSPNTYPTITPPPTFSQNCYYHLE